MPSISELQHRFIDTCIGNGCKDNPSNTPGFFATPACCDQQAQEYKYVAQSYFQNVPSAQRFGITMWNLTDADSWIVLSGNVDFPTLFNSSYQKKPAFSALLQGLK